MRRLCRILCLGIALLASAQFAVATPISVKAHNAVEVTYIGGGGPEAAAGFLVGERLDMIFSFDDATPDQLADPRAGQFVDPNGSIKLIGLTSGASLLYTDGIRIQVWEDVGFLNFRSADFSPTVEHPYTVFDDISFGTVPGASFFSNPNTLATVVADLIANPFPQGDDHDCCDARTRYYNELKDFGMRFETELNMNVTFSPVQNIPDGGSTVTMLTLGLLGLGAIRRMMR
jgi:hypothetical protein